jgi:hypothetical protein
VVAWCGAGCGGLGARRPAKGASRAGPGEGSAVVRPSVGEKEKQGKQVVGRRTCRQYYRPSTGQVPDAIQGLGKHTAVLGPEAQPVLPPLFSFSFSL